MAKNYYAILDVPPTATLEEIRSAYRTRAKQYHPDHFGRDSAPFLNVQEAYTVLSNPASRRSYDRSLRAQQEIEVVRLGSSPKVVLLRRPTAEPLKDPDGWPQPEPISPYRSLPTRRPWIDEMMEGLWSAFDLRLPPKAERLRTLTLEVVLTPEQACWDGRLRTRLPI